MAVTQLRHFQRYAEANGQFFNDLELEIQNLYSEVSKLNNKIASATAEGAIEVQLSSGQSIRQYSMVHVSQDKVATLADATLGSGNEATHIILEIRRGTNTALAGRKADAVYIPVQYTAGSGGALFLAANGEITNVTPTSAAVALIIQEVGMVYSSQDLAGNFECWLQVNPTISSLI